MVKHLLFLATTLFYAAGLFAQDDRIETDRPGESNSVRIVQKGYLQAELGFKREQANSQDYFYHHPKAAIRWGITKRFELRAEVIATTEKTSSAHETSVGLRPVELGFKASLWKSKSVLPAASLYTQVGFPKWASKAYQTNYVFPKTRLLFENKVSKKVTLNYNVGAEWQGKLTEPEWLLTFQPGVKIAKSWEGFIEYFVRTHSDTHPEHLLDGGLAFYPNRHIKLDASAGVGLSQGASHYFVALGLSFRVR